MAPLEYFPLSYSAYVAYRSTSHFLEHQPHPVCLMASRSTSQLLHASSSVRVCINIIHLSGSFSKTECIYHTSSAIYKICDIHSCGVCLLMTSQLRADEKTELVISLRCPLAVVTRATAAVSMGLKMGVSGLSPQCFSCKYITGTSLC